MNQNDISESGGGEFPEKFLRFFLFCLFLAWKNERTTEKNSNNKKNIMEKSARRKKESENEKYFQK